MLTKPFKRGEAPLMPRARREGGQSLVEFALTLPILLFIFMGIAEIGNILWAYTTLETAAREGARQAALGVPDQRVADIVSQIMQERLGQEDEFHQVWVNRSDLNSGAGGYAWADWSPECVYGDKAPCPGNNAANGVASLDDFNITAARLESDINQANRSAAGNPLNGTTFVMVAVHYEARTLTGFSLLRGSGRVPLTTYAILRQEVEQTTIDRLVSECPAYPIILMEEPLRTIEGTGALEPGMPLNGGLPAGHRFDGAQAGRDFAYVAWNQADRNNYPALVAGLTSTSEANNFSSVNRYDEFPRYGGVTDGDLQVGDWVLAWATNPTTYNDASLRQILESHKTNDRQLRVLVTSQNGTITRNDGGTGYAGWNIKDENGFAIIEIEEIEKIEQLIPNSGLVMDIRFVRYETGCGVEETN